MTHFVSPYLYIHLHLLYTSKAQSWQRHCKEIQGEEW